MQAGLLKNPIEIYTAVITTNEYGEQATEWMKVYSTRARLIHNGGNRELPNGEVYHNYMKTFEVREYVPISDFDRILFEGQFYRVVDIEPNSDQMKLIVRGEKVND